MSYKRRKQQNDYKSTDRGATTENRRICSNDECENVGVKRCAQCHSVHYCSKECQTNDWKNHKRFCKQYVQQRDFDNKKPTRRCCNNSECGKFGAKICNGCKSTYYCSNECQRKDWGNHKRFCKQTYEGNEFGDDAITYLCCKVLAQKISTAQKYFQRYPNDKAHAQRVQNEENLYCTKYLESQREHYHFPDDSFSEVNYAKRWGDCLLNADHLDAFVNAPGREFGDIHEKPYHPPSPHRFFQTMRGIGVTDQVYEFGNTYVGFGFVDMFQILWGRYENNNGFDVLTFHGFDQSRVTIVRSKLIYGIMKMFTESEISTSSILQIWFSSCWDQATKQAFQRVLTDALENNESYGLVKEDLPLLRKWQRADISIAIAKTKFSNNLQSSIFDPIWRLKSEHDRVMFCRYLFTGCIFVSEFNITCGNPTMFTEFDGQNRMSNESFFRAVDLKVFSRSCNQIVIWQSDSLFKTIISMTSNKTMAFRCLVNIGEIVCNFETKFVDPEDMSFAAQIQSLQPYGIDWSNIPDYMARKKFIRFAASCSVEETSHDVHFINWTHYVFGASLVDYAVKRDECDNIYKAFKSISRQRLKKTGTSRWDRFFQAEEYVNAVDAVNVFLTYLYGDTFEDFFLSSQFKWMRNSRSVYSFLSNQSPSAFRRSFCFVNDDDDDDAPVFVSLGVLFLMRYNYVRHDTLGNFLSTE